MQDFSEYLDFSKDLAVNAGKYYQNTLEISILLNKNPQESTLLLMLI